MMQEAEVRKLIAQLRASFGSGEFDTTRIMLVAQNDSPQLLAVLESTIPNCRRQRRRSGWYLRHEVIERALVGLVEQYFVVEPYGWWRLRQSTFPDGG